MLNPLLREIHRLRKLVRDAQGEIDQGPRVHKARLAKLATVEKALADAREGLKKRKADILTAEATIKSLNQSIAKHEKQLDTLKAPREIEAKNHDIATAKAGILQQEDDLLAAMTDVDERTARLPEFEAAAVKAKADFAVYEKDATERFERLKGEVLAATKTLADEEAKIPLEVRPQYDRLVKAHGADALAAVENQGCAHCRVGITDQNMQNLRKNEFSCCRNCGRAFYLA